MGELRDRVDDVYRAYNTPGDPSSGALRPLKSAIRSLLGDIADAVEEAPIKPGVLNAAYDFNIPDNSESGAPYVDNNLGWSNSSGYPATNEPFDDRTRNIGNAAHVYRDGNGFEVMALGYSALNVGDNFEHPTWGPSFVLGHYCYWLASDISGGGQTYGLPRIGIGTDITGPAMLGDDPHPFSGGPQVWLAFQHDSNEGMTTLRARRIGGGAGSVHVVGNLTFSETGTLPGNLDAFGDPQPITGLALPMEGSRYYLRETFMPNTAGIFVNIDDAATVPVNDDLSAWRWAIGPGLDGEIVQRMAPDGTGGWRTLRIMDEDGKSSHRLLGLNITGSAKTAGIAQLVAGTVTIATTAAKSGCMPLVTRRGKGGSAFGTMNVTIADDTSITITSIRANGDTETNDTSAVSWAIINQTDMG